MSSIAHRTEVEFSSPASSSSVPGNNPSVAVAFISADNQKAIKKAEEAGLTVVKTVSEQSASRCQCQWSLKQRAVCCLLTTTVFAGAVLGVIYAASPILFQGLLDTVNGK